MPNSGLLQGVAAPIASYSGDGVDYPIFYYVTTPTLVGGGNFGVGNNGTEVVIPFPVTRRSDGTLPVFGAIGCNVVTAFAASTFRLGIRRSARGLPTSVVYDSGSLSSAATGWVESLFTWAPETPGLWFLAIQPSSTSCAFSGLNSSVQLPQTSLHRRGIFNSGNIVNPGGITAPLPTLFLPFNGGFWDGTNNAGCVDDGTGPLIQLKVVG